MGLNGMVKWKVKVSGAFVVVVVVGWIKNNNNNNKIDRFDYQHQEQSWPQFRPQLGF